MLRLTTSTSSIRILTKGVQPPFVTSTLKKRLANRPPISVLSPARVCHSDIKIYGPKAQSNPAIHAVVLSNQEEFKAFLDRTEKHEGCFFHGTSQTHADNIIEKGVIGYIYITPDKQLAAHYSSSHSRPKILLMRVPFNTILFNEAFGTIFTGVVSSIGVIEANSDADILTNNSTQNRPFEIAFQDVFFQGIFMATITSIPFGLDYLISTFG